MPTFSSVGHALQFGNSSPTVTIVGTDTDGYISYDMSTSATFFQFAPNTKYFALQVIFSTPFIIPPGVTISPANNITAQLATAIPAVEFFASQTDVTTTYFKISGISSSTPLLGPQVLMWSYQIGGAQVGGGGGGTVTSVATTSPLSGGPITGSGTISIPKATSSVDGYLSQTDWATFNSKLSSAVTSIATSAPLTGGTITATGTLGITKSTTSTDGYLSSADWNTFNSKLSAAVTSVATNSTLSGGTITSTGTLSINLSNPNTWLAKQTFSSHIAVDGYNIDLSSGAATNQVLQYNGSNFIAATISNSITYEVNFHTADWAKNAAQAGLASSAYTCAVWFNLAKAGQITGARWYQPTGFTGNVTVKLWDDGDTLLKTVTITPTAGAINTATFATAYSHTPSNMRLYLSVYDGTNAILYNTSPNKPGSYASGATGVVGGLWGPELWQHGHGFSVGDNSPNTADDRFIGIEPLYTIP